MKHAVLALVLAVSSAHAQTPQEQARVLYDDGSRRYNLREYHEAVAAFRKAYDLFPDPQFLFNIAQSYRQLDDCKNAREFYKSYLRTEPTADNREQVERLIAATDECVQRHDAERADAKRREQTQAPVIVTRTDHAGLRLAGIITGSVGVVMLAGGVYFSRDAADQASKVESLCAEGCTTADIAAIDRKGLDSERDAIILYAVGGAAVAAGIGLYIWARRKSRDSVVVTPTKNGVAAMVRF